MYRLIQILAIVIRLHWTQKCRCHLDILILFGFGLFFDIHTVLRMVAYMVVVSRLRAHHRRGNRNIMRAKDPIVCMSTVFNGLTAAGTARAHQASRKYQRG